ncbi:MAG TPA: hypothetical protein VIK59_13785 [Verrucomicrobiae bacterium]
MIKIATCILGLFLICLKVQAIQISTTLDPNSTPGNFSGALDLSFDSSDSSAGLAGNYWGEAFATPSYTVGGAQIFFSLTIGQEGANEMNLYTGVSFLDPRILDPDYTLPGAYPIFSGGSFIVGQSKDLEYSYSSGNLVLLGYTGMYPMPIGTLDFSFSLPVVFDGTSGSGSGSWSLTYTINDSTKVPDNGKTILLLLAGFLLLGGFHLGTSRANRRRKN